MSDRQELLRTLSCPVPGIADPCLVRARLRTLQGACQRPDKGDPCLPEFFSPSAPIEATEAPIPDASLLVRNVEVTVSCPGDAVPASLTIPAGTFEATVALPLEANEVQRSFWTSGLPLLQAMVDTRTYGVPDLIRHLALTADQAQDVYDMLRATETAVDEVAATTANLNLVCRWLSDPQTATCPDGAEGDAVAVDAGAFVSEVSKADANAQALALATAQLVCLYWNTVQTATCADIEQPMANFGTLTALVEAHSVSSTISVAAANDAAYQLALGQLDCRYGNTEIIISCLEIGALGDTLTIPAGTFVDESAEAAQAAAEAAAAASAPCYVANDALNCASVDAWRSATGEWSLTETAGWTLYTLPPRSGSGVPAGRYTIAVTTSEEAISGQATVDAAAQADLLNSCSYCNLPIAGSCSQLIEAGVYFAATFTRGIAAAYICGPDPLSILRQAEILAATPSLDRTTPYTAPVGALPSVVPECYIESPALKISCVDNHPGVEPRYPYPKYARGLTDASLATVVEAEAGAYRLKTSTPTSTVDANGTPVTPANALTFTRTMLNRELECVWTNAKVVCDCCSGLRPAHFTVDFRAASEFEDLTEEAAARKQWVTEGLACQRDAGCGHNEEGADGQNLVWSGSYGGHSNPVVIAAQTFTVSDRDPEWHVEGDDTYPRQLRMVNCKAQQLAMSLRVCFWLSAPVDVECPATEAMWDSWQPPGYVGLPCVFAYRPDDTMVPVSPEYIGCPDGEPSPGTARIPMMPAASTPATVPEHPRYESRPFTVEQQTFYSNQSQGDANKQAMNFALSLVKCRVTNQELTVYCGASVAAPEDVGNSTSFGSGSVAGHAVHASSVGSSTSPVVVGAGAFETDSYNESPDPNYLAVRLGQHMLDCFWGSVGINLKCDERALMALWITQPTNYCGAGKPPVLALGSGSRAGLPVHPFSYGSSETVVEVPEDAFFSHVSQQTANRDALVSAVQRADCFFLNAETRVMCDDARPTDEALLSPVQPGDAVANIITHGTGSVGGFPVYGDSRGATTSVVTVPKETWRSEVSQQEANRQAALVALGNLDCFFVNPEIIVKCPALAKADLPVTARSIAEYPTDSATANTAIQNSVTAEQVYAEETFSAYCYGFHPANPVSLGAAAANGELLDATAITIPKGTFRSATWGGAIEAAWTSGYNSLLCLYTSSNERVSCRTAELESTKSSDDADIVGSVLSVIGAQHAAGQWAKQASQIMQLRLAAGTAPCCNPKHSMYNYMLSLSNQTTKTRTVSICAGGKLLALNLVTK